MKHRITAHISPYLGGLAPETHHFVSELNREATRLKLPVRFTAMANRILATGDLKRAAKSHTLSGWTLRRAIKNGYLAHERRPVWLNRPIRQQTNIEIEGEQPVLKRGISQHRGKLRRYEKNARIAPEVQQSLKLWRDRWRRLYLNLNARSCVVGGGSQLAEFAELVRLARAGEAPLTPQEVLEGKIEVAAGTLFQLVRAIPQWERDEGEIYPGDFRRALDAVYSSDFIPKDTQLTVDGRIRYARIPEPLRTNWDADKLEWWRQLGWKLVDVKRVKNDHGLNDYSQPTRLLCNGSYRTAPRQKAAPPFHYNWLGQPWRGFDPADVERILKAPLKAQDYGLDPHWDAIWRDCDTRLIFYALGQLRTPDAQQLLVRIGRLYKIDCYRPGRKDTRARVRLDPIKQEIAVAAVGIIAAVDPKISNQDIAADLRVSASVVRAARQPRRGGAVVVRIPGVHRHHVAAKRYVQLAATQESDNKKWASYLNEIGLSKRLRELRSLNIATPLVVRQIKSADTCQPFTKTLTATQSAERPCSPLLAESPKRRRANLRPI